MTRSAKGSRPKRDSAPALFLDQFEELRMDLSNEQLIAEAIDVNHAGVGQESTRERYRDHLGHFDRYLASVFGASFYTARPKHVRMFMNHLEKQGGASPHDSRLRCEWCRSRGYPDGRDGCGWSASYFFADRAQAGAMADLPCVGGSQGNCGAAGASGRSDDAAGV